MAKDADIELAGGPSGRAKRVDKAGESKLLREMSTPRPSNEEGSDNEPFERASRLVRRSGEESPDATSIV